MFKTTFSGKNKIWGALPPNASPWSRTWYSVCLKIQFACFL